MPAKKNRYGCVLLDSLRVFLGLGSDAPPSGVDCTLSRPSNPVQAKKSRPLPNASDGAWPLRSPIVCFLLSGQLSRRVVVDERKLR